MDMAEISVVTVGEAWVREGIGAEGAKQGATGYLEISVIVVWGRGRNRGEWIATALSKTALSKWSGPRARGEPTANAGI